ncbi:MAG TPA: hypothetical protein VKY92_09850 [Verrucomicrobiae bacterium]|nr:hypothetical protein [Verrucomicrobiae bacterium]
MDLIALIGRLINRHAPSGRKQLPLEIQNFIDNRVNSAMEAARESMRRDVAEAKRELDQEVSEIRVNNRNRTIGGSIVAAICVVLTWRFGYGEVRELTEKYVKDHMNEPEFDKIARVVISNRADVFVSERLVPLKQTVLSLGSDIAQAQDQLTKITEEQRIVTLITRAEALDKLAFIQLMSMSKGTNKFSSIAAAEVLKVTRMLRFENVNQAFSTPMLVATDGMTFEGPFTNDELYEQLSNPDPEGAVNAVSSSQLKLFIPKLVELAHGAGSLMLLKRVSLALHNLTRVSYEPWDTQSLDAWWENQQANYKKWPGKDFEEGLLAFSMVNYSKALPAFEAVLAVDPDAEKSRALAISCAVDLGLREKAEQLYSKFSNKDGRWAQWSKAKMLLASGAIEQGTRELAGLVLKYPIMREAGYARSANAVWQKINWPLYERLRTASTNTLATEPQKPKQEP